MIKECLIILVVSLLFPLVNAWRSTLPYLAFLDTWTIMGCFLLIGGCFYGLSLHGHFDLLTYTLHHMVLHDDTEFSSFDEYRDDRNAKRTGRKNSPLWTGAFVLGCCILLSFFYK